MTNEITNEEFTAAYRAKLLEIQDQCATEEQVELPLLHDFAPGLYLRRIFMPAGTFVIGRTHKTEHFNIVLSGSARVMADGVIMTIKAPHVFKSSAGVKKALYILEDMVWLTTHPTDLTEPDELEKALVLSDEEERKTTLEEFKKYDVGSNSGRRPDSRGRDLGEPSGFGAKGREYGECRTD